jgi:hypothetical protein
LDNLFIFIAALIEYKFGDESVANRLNSFVSCSEYADRVMEI